MMRSIPDEMLTLLFLCGNEKKIRTRAFIDDFNKSLMVILFDENDNRIGDAICYEGSYGHELGLLEIMGKGCPKNDIVGGLTAEEVIQKWKGEN